MTPNHIQEKGRPMRITVKQLEKLGVCEDTLAIVAMYWGESVDITEQSCAEAAALGLDVAWAAPHLLSDAQCEQYLATTKPACEQYLAIEKPAKEKYDAIEGPAWEKYCAIREQAWDKYLAIREPAKEQYEAIHKSAWEKYDAYCWQAFYWATQG